MRKREFLRELRKRLNRTGCRETEDIVEYYDELIEDTIDRTGKREEDVVYDLGPISDIVIRVNTGRGTATESRESRIRYDEYEGEEKGKPVRENKSRKKEKSGSVLIGVLVAVLTFPIWFGILMALVGIVIGAVCAGIGIGIAGICFIGYGICTLGAGFANALFQIGLGIVFIGLTFILAPLLVKIISGLMKLVIRFVKWLMGLSDSKRRTCYEN